VMGDEVRRTQQGNNNAYCLDTEANWFDWSLLQKHEEVHRFVKLLIARRLLRDAGGQRQRTTLTELIAKGAKGWHGVKLNQPDWSGYSHTIAFSAELAQENFRAHFIFNAYWEALDFELPDMANGSSWRRWIDTSSPTPQDIVPWQESPLVGEQTYRAAPRSVVVLWAPRDDGLLASM
jgi:isoamylase